ncbi:hypothetical protein [Levilactobacillus andaensis]|uniref:hypothetical protein n=1 Tax=Levilactobacillus andaensis TaxID=2799570 RepID=UPI00194045B4|nr:hypothetical protein [Levilactobacillus andaensis]
MFTLPITRDDYDLLNRLDKEALIDAEWVKIQGESVRVHFKDFESFDSFMAILNDMEATLGMDKEQENLTPIGVRLQNLYDKAYYLEEDEE